LKKKISGNYDNEIRSSGSPTKISRNSGYTEGLDKSMSIHSNNNTKAS